MAIDKRQTLVDAIKKILRPLVSRLRRKLVKFPGGDKWISNVRGTGYVLDIAEEA